jgi:DNA polymerase elongation subunit (family B)
MNLKNLSDKELLELYKKIDSETKLHSFAMFITYNIHDVGVLFQLDKKFKLMQLVNQMAHENTVPFVSIMGTVRYVETGIVNRAHNVHNRIVNDKIIPTEDNEKVEGAIVMTPRAGLHEWIGSVDITSLYPSVCRALNMSIETFVGQFTEEERAWEGIRASDNTQWEVQINGESFWASGAEWNSWLRESKFALSAFGTVFDQNKPGMLSDALTYWFEERIRLQTEKKKYAKLLDAAVDPIKMAEYEKLVEYYDLLQLTKKIQLNSAYGATLNENFRLGRREIGASITGSGRQITRHMGETIAEYSTGKKWTFEKRFADFKNKNTRVGSFESGELYSQWQKQGEFERLRSLPAVMQWSKKWSKEHNRDIDVGSGAIWFTDCPTVIYGDTDSCYFLTGAKDYDAAVSAADDIAERTNKTFPAFMQESFNCTEGRELLIKAAREVVAERGMFMFAKKKYTLKVVNLDGKDLRGPDGTKFKLKSMGSEIKKADTPKVIQEFLKEMMSLVLAGEPYSVLEKFVNAKRGSMIGPDIDVLSLAPAKQVNNLDTYYAEYKRTEKVGAGRCKLPGHVRAAINYNELLQMYDPEGALKPLKAGDKAAILYLKPNHLGLKSIGFPAELGHLPDWFKQELEVDMELTEKNMIDSKIESIFEVLGEEMPTPQNSFLNSTFTF